eukprot:SAG31_NODE_3396_length_4317_cov_3.774591_3_plen_63_part_00
MFYYIICLCPALRSATSFLRAGAADAELQLEKQRASQLGEASAQLVAQQELAAAQILDLRGR